MFPFTTPLVDPLANFCTVTTIAHPRTNNITRLCNRTHIHWNDDFKHGTPMATSQKYKQTNLPSVCFPFNTQLVDPRYLLFFKTVTTVTTTAHPEQFPSVRSTGHIHRRDKPIHSVQEAGLSEACEATTTRDLCGAVPALHRRAMVFRNTSLHRAQELDTASPEAMYLKQ